jgi:DNA-binding beta-propeller fold protein YncE
VRARGARLPLAVVLVVLRVAIAAEFPAASPAAAQVYVANANADAVLVFDPATTGNQAPLQEITATPGFMDLASSVAVHVGREELFVAARGPDEIYVFDLGADGPTVPLRLISGVTTTIDTPWDLELDPERGDLWVLSTGASELLVFAVGGGGNVAPLRTLGTSPAWPTSTIDFDLDLVHNEVVITDRTPGAAAIRFLPLLGNGTVGVLRSISGPATGLTDPAKVAVDPLHDEVFVVNQASIRVFARGASGDVAPLRVLSGAATGLGGIHGFDVDPLAGPGGSGELAVLRSVPDDALFFFPRTANGNVAPLRAIVGAATHFNGTSQISYFPTLIFADGYASGSTAAWSAAVP